MIVTLLIVGIVLTGFSACGMAWQFGKAELKAKHLEARIDAYEGAVDMFREAEHHRKRGDEYTSNVFYTAANQRVQIARGWNPTVSVQA